MDQPVSIILLPLVAGYLLDLLLGDPRWLPHPIRWFGNMISFGEKRLNKGESRFFKGLILTVSLVAFVFAFLWFLIYFVKDYTIAYYIVSSILVFYSLANKSLIQEGNAVSKELDKGLESGRSRLSWIVGRDTSQLNENQIKKAILETWSENLSDGVIAPLFFYAILGVPGMLGYKMVNTFDSMIGYKSDRYIQFGKFAALLDDVVNFIPARITALLMVLVTASKRGLIYIFKYGNKHASPNAGYPEAALAGILNCQFGGTNIYHGKKVEKPFIGELERDITQKDLLKTSLINHSVTFVMVLLIISIYVIIL